MNEPESKNLDSNSLLCAEVPQDSQIPIWPWIKSYTGFIYDYPMIPIVVTLFLTFLLSSLLIFYYGVRPQASTNNYRWSGDPILNKWDAFLGAAKNSYSSLLNLFGTTLSFPSQSQLSQLGAIIYERPYTNILEVDALREIWKTEDLMHATPGWENVCYIFNVSSFPTYLKGAANSFLSSLNDTLPPIEKDTGCFSFKSLIIEFKEDLKKHNNMVDPLPNDLNQSYINSFIKRNEEKFITLYFGNDYDNTTMTSTRVRTIVPFALPIKGYTNTNDRHEEQLDKIGEWQLEFMKPCNQMIKDKPLGINAYPALTFALDLMISKIVLKNAAWIGGSFAFLFIFAVAVHRSFFTSLLGVIGVFFPIPCALCCLKLIFRIDHVDVIDVIGLFLICGIGADCVFIIFELFRQSKVYFGSDNKKRLAYAAQRGLIALSTSISTSAVSFLALLTSGVRIMNFFGLFCFLLLVFTFIYTFTWYLGVLSIWSKKWETKEPESNDFESQTNISMFTTQSEEQTKSDVYPKPGLMAFLHNKPTFYVNAAHFPIHRFNPLERFAYNKFAPFVYFYRLPIVLVSLLASIICGYYCMKIPTKSELQFLADDHPIQKTYYLSVAGFNTAIGDFSFIYVWGIEDTTEVSFSDRLTIDNYGKPKYRDLNISDPVIQGFLHKAWEIINNETDIIDVGATKVFGANPWGVWQDVFSLAKKINLVVPWIKPLYNISMLPEKYPISDSDMKDYGFLWQLFLSKLAIDEPDPYVPGTQKINTIGFSKYDYSLKHIGMKANFKIPKVQNVETLRALYDKAEALAKKIEKHAPENFEGFMTSVGWLNMVTEEMLPKQIVQDVIMSLACAAIVFLASTGNFWYCVCVVYSMGCTVLIILGALYFTGWAIGTNEAIMVSIASGFCAEFIIQPIIAMAHDHSKRSVFARLQASITTFAMPVSCALITTLVAACFLYPCEILLFPPFATFLLGSGLFGIIHGFVVLPALIAIFSSDHKNKKK